MRRGGRRLDEGQVMIKKEASREGEAGMKAGVSQSSPEDPTTRAAVGVLGDLW